MIAPANSIAGRARGSYFLTTTRRVMPQSRLAWTVLCLSFLCCVFEGALRKWVLGEGSLPGRVAYLSKDILMVGILAVGVGRSNAMTAIASPYLLCGLILLGLGALLSMVSGIDPIGALLTVKTFFLLPLAAFMAGRLLPADSLRRLAITVALLSLPLAVLGILQFFSPQSSVLNRYSSYGDLISTAGSQSSRVRATGTFSYITGFGEFAPVGVWAGIVCFSLARTVRERWLGYAALVAGLCCALVTVSRAVALISLGLIAVWALAGGQFGRKAQILLTITVATIVAVYLGGWWDDAEEVITTVYWRHMTPQNKETIGDRLLYGYAEPLGAFAIAPLGEGLGSQQSAMLVVGSDASRRALGQYESPWGKLVLELGVAGLLGFIVTLGVVFAPLVAIYRRCPSGGQKTALAVTGMVLLAKAAIGFPFNHVSAYLFWAVAATVLALGNGMRLPQSSTTTPRSAAVLRRSVT